MLFRDKFRGLSESNNSSWQGALYTVGNIFPQIIRLLLLPVFTRYLSPEEYGIINYTNSICTFLSIFTVLSLNSFVLRHYFDCKNENEKKKLFGSIFLFMMVLNGTFLILELSTGQAIIKYTNVKVPFSPYFQLAFLNVALEIVSMLPPIFYRVRKEARKFVIFTMGKTFLTIMLSLIFVVPFRMGVLGRYFGMLSANMVFSFISLAIVWKISTFVWDVALIKKGLQYAVPILPLALGGILMSISDRVILERYVPLSELGLYSIGSLIGQMPLGAISNGMYKAIEPNIFQKFNEKRFDQYIVHIKKNCISIILLFAIPVGLFSQEILMIMAAPEFHAIYSIVPIFVLSVVLETMAMPAILYLYALKKTQFMPFITLLGVGVNIGAGVLLIPRIGIYGGAISTLLANVASFLATILIIKSICSNRIRWNYFLDIFHIFTFSLPVLCFVYLSPFNDFNLIISISMKFVVLCACWIIISTKLLNSLAKGKMNSQLSNFFLSLGKRVLI